MAMFGVFREAAGSRRNVTARASSDVEESREERLLAVDFSFRGSLGDDVAGRDGWRAYRDRVRRAVPDFHNEIVDIVSRARSRCCTPHVQRSPPWCLARSAGPR